MSLAIDVPEGDVSNRWEAQVGSRTATATDSATDKEFDWRHDGPMLGRTESLSTPILFGRQKRHRAAAWRPDASGTLAATVLSV